MTHSLGHLHYHADPEGETLASLATLFGLPPHSKEDPLRRGLLQMGFESHHTTDCPHCRAGDKDGLAAGEASPDIYTQETASVVADILGPVAIAIPPSTLAMFALVVTSYGAWSSEQGVQRAEFMASLQGGSI